VRQNQMPMVYEVKITAKAANLLFFPPASLVGQPPACLRNRQHEHEA